MASNIFKIFARAVIINEQGKYLLVKNKNAPGDFNKKAFLPGGKLEYLEDIEDCIIREIKEEVDLEVVSMDIVITQKIILEGVHWFGVYYVCKTKNLNFKNNEPEKIEKVFWGEYNDLDDYGKKVIDKLNN